MGCPAYLSVTNGTLYVSLGDNNLYAFDLAASTLNPPECPEPTSLQPDFMLTPYVGGKAIRR